LAKAAFIVRLDYKARLFSSKFAYYQASYFAFIAFIFATYFYLKVLLSKC